MYFYLYSMTNKETKKRLYKIGYSSDHPITRMYRCGRLYTQPKKIKVTDANTDFHFELIYKHNKANVIEHNIKRIIQKDSQYYKNTGWIPTQFDGITECRLYSREEIDNVISIVKGIVKQT